jgi:hypothetical protein
MKKEKISSPVSLLLSINDDGMGVEVEKYLNEKNLNGGLIFQGKGTAESEIADIFGFGLSDRDIIAVFIPKNKSSEIIKDINEITGVEKDKYGLNMILEINSASSNLLDLLGVKID